MDETTRVVRNVAFLVVNRNGPDQFVSIYAKASLKERGNPTIPHEVVEVVSRHRGLELVVNPFLTFFDTEPLIGRDIRVSGYCLDLSFVLVDRMVRYGYSEQRKIIAIGCLRGNEGVVGKVDDFERKLDLLLKSDLRDFLFIFPKANLSDSVRGKLQDLVEKQGAEWKAIDNLDDVKFLWTLKPADGAKPADRRTWKWIAAGTLALAAVAFVLLAMPPPLSLPSQHLAGEQPPPPPEKSIWTSGPKGYYQTQLCPPLPSALAKRYLPGYGCVPTSGTLDNIERVLANPTSIALVQLDVYIHEEARRREEFGRLTVIPNYIACEGLWMITKRSDLTLDKVRKDARKIPVILPPKGSGPAATFSILQEHDTEGLGQVPEANIHNVFDATKVIEETASSTDGAVGFIVQVAEPGNENIRLMMEKGLTVIPMALSPLVYQEGTFTLKSGIFGISATRVTTACTPVAIITGDPAAFSDGLDRRNQEDLIRKLKEVPAAALVPHKNW